MTESTHVTLLTEDEAQIDDTLSQLQEMDISDDMKRLIEKGLRNRHLPQVLKSNKAAKAFQHAFELIGGVPRLALWADRNPDKFYALYSRMIPSTVNEVLPLVGGNQEQDNPFPWVTAERIRAQQAIEVADDIKKASGQVVPIVKRIGG